MRRQTDSNNLADYPHVDLLYPSNYLKGADLDGEEVVTVKAIEPRHELARTDNTKERKPVVMFTETEKRWVMNKTNAKTIAGLYGPELTAWIGQRIILRTEKVSAFGKVHDAIRVKPEKPGARRGSGGGVDDALAGFEVAETEAELTSAWRALPKGLTKPDLDRARVAFQRRMQELRAPRDDETERLETLDPGAPPEAPAA